jgi:hypothetical protein
MTRLTVLAVLLFLASRRQACTGRLDPRTQQVEVRCR